MDTAVRASIGGGLRLALAVLAGSPMAACRVTTCEDDLACPHDYIVATERADAAADARPPPAADASYKDGDATAPRDAELRAEASAPDAPSGDCDPNGSPSDAPCLVDDAWGVFVSRLDGDDLRGRGTRSAPFRTLTRGLADAKGNRSRLFACDDGAGFDESVTLDASHSGIRIYGGYDCEQWTHSASRPTSVRPTAAVVPLVVRDVISAVIEDMAFTASDAAEPGHSSIAAFLVASSGIKLVRVALTAGSATNGDDGTTTANYTAVPPDDPRIAGRAATASGAGATQVCGRLCSAYVFGTGGRGGDARDHDDGNGPSGDGDGGGSDGSRGNDGNRGAAEGGDGGDLAAGAPGSGGDGTPGYSPAHPPTATGQGGVAAAACDARGAGSRGSDAPSGPSGRGATRLGALGRDGWSPADGKEGGTGAPGQGGGGGSAGRAAFGDAGTTVPGFGGGGACGGCGGGGGRGGRGGGSSFALLSYRSDVSVEHCHLQAGAAGRGGRGGDGQVGQRGGNGGAPFAGGCPGGNGGDGGDGAPAGGGAGGSSVAVGYVGLAVAWDTATVLLVAGAGGQGGQPGAAARGSADGGSAPDADAGSAATRGADGVARTVLELPEP